MCQPKDKGGRRCPMHQPASIGLRNFIRTNYGLEEGQVNHTFRSLRQQGENRPNPTPEEYEHFISRQKAVLGNSNLSEKESRRVERQYKKELSESELPDGATFFALKKLLPRSRDQKREMSEKMREVARHNNVTSRQALRDFREQYENHETSNKSSYDQTFDARTTEVLDIMLDRRAIDAHDNVPTISEEPRIEREDWTNRSSWIRAVGYDADDGRMEIETDSGVYAYRNVGEAQFRAIDENMRGAPSIISRTVMRNPVHAYESREERDRDAYGVWCRDCSRYRAASGHSCEGPSDETIAAREEQAQNETISQSQAEADTETVNATTGNEESEIQGQATGSKLSYEESLQRLKEQMNDDSSGSTGQSSQQESRPRQRRQRRGPTARQRRWMRDESEREVEDFTGETPESSLNNNRGGPDFYQPNHSSVRRALMTNGNVAKVDFSRRISTYSDAEGMTFGNVTIPVQAHVEGEKGDVKVSRRGAPQCDCEQYQRSGRCSHLCEYAGVPNSADDQELQERLEQNSALKMNQFHRNISRESYLRSRSEEGGPVTVNLTGPEALEDLQSRPKRTQLELSKSNISGTVGGVTGNKSDWKTFRNMIDSGDTVRIASPGGGYGTQFNFTNWDNNEIEGHRISNFAVDVSKDENGEIQMTLPDHVGDQETNSCHCGVPHCPGQHALKEYVQAGLDGHLRRGNHSGTMTDDGIEEASIPTRNRGRSAPEQEDYSQMTAEQRLERLDQYVSSAWVTNDSQNEEFHSAFRQETTGIDKRYSANLDQYISDYREAEKKMKNGESPMEYTYENATNGVCSPESGRGFGVEIEFDLGSSRRVSTERIARELYDEGLTTVPYQQGYHTNAASGYQSWTFENDVTVDGEIVSPVLHDTPESWEQIEKVCNIVKRNGGKATARTGQHVHMGLVTKDEKERGVDVERKKLAATQVYAAYQDTMRRVQTDPKRKSHRDSEWAQPMRENSTQRNIYSMQQGRNHFGNDHFASMNMGHQGRIEFRGADGSLDPAHIQAQVMTSAAVVSAAERGEYEGERMKYSEVGRNRKKADLISSAKKTQRNAKSDDEIVVTDAELRNFTDEFMNYEHGRKMMVGIAANTPWQKESRYANR